MAAPLRLHVSQTLALGLPLVGSQLAQVLIGLTDTLMLGRYSVDALAAATLGTSVFFAAWVLGSGFGYAVMPVVASAAARGDEATARRATRMGAWLSVLFGVAILPVLWLSGPLLRALGQDPDLVVLVQGYLRVAGFGLVPFLLVTVLRSHLGGLEHTRIILWATLAGVALNVGLNWLLIFGNAGFPELGVRGAAIASVGVHCLTLAVLALYATRHPALRRYDLLRNVHLPEWDAFRRLFRLGAPIGLTHFAEGSLFFGAGFLIGTIGVVELAAHGIALQIASATFMVHLGLSNAATIRVGRAAGAGRPGDLRRAAWAALLLSAAAVALSTALFLVFGRALVSLFLDPSDPAAPAILRVGVVLVAMAALFQAVDAAQVMALGFLRGVQDTERPMLYAIASYWLLGIPCSWFLGLQLGLGAVGVWWGLVIGLAAASATLMTRFWRMAPAPAAA